MQLPYYISLEFQLINLRFWIYTIHGNGMSIPRRHTEMDIIGRFD